MSYIEGELVTVTLPGQPPAPGVVLSDEQDGTAYVAARYSAAPACLGRISTAFLQPRSTAPAAAQAPTPNSGPTA